MNFLSSVLSKRLFLYLLMVCISTKIGIAYTERTHGYIYTQNEIFTESSRALNNPCRGFYFMYGFIPGHDNQDLQEIVLNRLKTDPRMLAMIQINLGRFIEKPISEKGLQDIDNFFQELEKLEKQYIVRFLYDWEGKSLTTEPQDAETILNHMRQLEMIFNKYSDIIFVHQGLFIGNWGEMNGTKHLGEMQRLVLQLAAVTDEKTYLAVRMPAQWRSITGLANVTTEAVYKSSLVRRLGLFNDGIMGNVGDYGTYGTKTKVEAGLYGLWNRTEELEFQDMLCRHVPNGGEVIIDNPYNDFENAITDLAKMHITYLNLDYDRNVLNKWANSKVTEEGCFYGMDGLTYIERHLGYRILIDNAILEYNFLSDDIEIKINLKNIGFAPLYREPEIILRIYSKETGLVKNYLVTAELRSLFGGVDKNQKYTISADISLEGFEPGEYEVYFCIKDVDSNQYIFLANDQDMQELGYLVGRFIADDVKNSFIIEPLDLNKENIKNLEQMEDWQIKVN